MRLQTCASSLPPGARPVLGSFGEECRDAALRILAYAGALALIGLVIVHGAGPLTNVALESVAVPAIAASTDPPCPKLAVRAEPTRPGCAPNRVPSVAADWTTAGSTLALRGGLSMN
jgi:hypothetical protein